MLKREFTNEETKYFHQGVVGDNGHVDIYKIIDDPNLLRVLLGDYSNHPKLEIGNLEVWYFDIIDLQNKCSIIVQFYFQTEPLRNELGFYATIFTHTMEYGVYNKLKKYHIDELIISQNTFDIKIEKNHIYRKYHPESKIYTYYLEARIEDITLDLEFLPEVEGWKPFGDSVLFKDENRAGSFSVISFIPKAKVIGTFTNRNKRYELKNAFGYHDHTCWESRYKSEKFKRRLFVDDTITKWEFGKFVSSEYVIIFSIIYLRPWLNQTPIKTFLVAKNDKIIHSSNNLIKVIHSDFEIDRNTLNKYPTKILVELIQKDNIIKLDLKLKEIIAKKDLLVGIDTLSKSLIRLFFGKPASYYMITEAKFTISNINGDTENLKGSAFYELMILNNRPTHFEDYLRKTLHKMIR